MKLFEEKEKKEREMRLLVWKKCTYYMKTEYPSCGIQFEALPSGIEAATL